MCLYNEVWPVYAGQSSCAFLSLLIPAGHGLCCDDMEELQSILFCFSDLFLEKVVEYYVRQCVLNVQSVFCFLTTSLKLNVLPHDRLVQKML